MGDTENTCYGFEQNTNQSPFTNSDAPCASGPSAEWLACLACHFICWSWRFGLKTAYNPRPCSPSRECAKQHVCFAHGLPTGQQLQFFAQSKHLNWNLSSQQSSKELHRRNLDEVLAWPPLISPCSPLSIGSCLKKCNGNHEVYPHFCPRIRLMTPAALLLSKTLGSTWHWLLETLLHVLWKVRTVEDHFWLGR